MAGLAKRSGNKNPRIARVFIILIARAGFTHSPTIEKDI